MFGWWRKAKQDAQAIRYEVIDDLSRVFVHVTYAVGVAHGCDKDEAKHRTLLERQGSMVQGIELIRQGAHPKEIPEPRAKAAASVAWAAVNTAILTGKLDLEKIAAELQFILEREYSQYEVQEAEETARMASGPFTFGR
jgi:hypothetical protein